MKVGSWSEIYWAGEFNRKPHIFFLEEQNKQKIYPLQF